MSTWRLHEKYAICSNSFATSSNSTFRAWLPDGASINTKGAWVEFCASLPFDIGKMVLQQDVVTMSGTYSMIDVGIGTNGNELTIVENLIYGIPVASQYFLSNQYVIPISLKAGTRVIGRQQSTNTGQNSIGTTLQLYSLSMNERSCAQCLTLGANTAATLSSFAIDPGATINTKGAWTEISASLPFTVRAIIIADDQSNGVTSSSAAWSVDVGIGSAGNEQAKIKDFTFKEYTTYKSKNPRTSGLLEVVFPAGQRLSMRCANYINTAATRILRPIIYLFG